MEKTTECEQPVVAPGSPCPFAHPCPLRVRSRTLRTRECVRPGGPGCAPCGRLPREGFYDTDQRDICIDWGPYRRPAPGVPILPPAPSCFWSDVLSHAERTLTPRFGILHISCCAQELDGFDHHPELVGLESSSLLKIRTLP